MFHSGQPITMVALAMHIRRSCLFSVNIWKKKKKNQINK